MKKVTKYLSMIPAVLLFSAPVSYASETYQTAVGGFHSQTDNDDDLEITTMAIAAQYFLKPVSTENAPYGEASFLNRQSSFLGAFGTLDVDIFSVSIDGTNLIVGFEFADPAQPITASILYNTSKADDTVFDTNIELTLDVVQLELGYHIDRNSRITFQYVQSEAEIKIENDPDDFKAKADGYGLVYKNVMELAGDQFFNLEVGAVMVENDEDDKNNEFSALGDYYFNRAASVRVGYAVNSGDDIFEEGSTLTLGANFFLQPNIAIGIEMQQFSADEDNNDEDTVTIDFEARF